MGKFYAGLIGVAVLALGFLWAVIGAKRRGLSAGEAKGAAREAIDRIRDAVDRGDDAEVQRLLEEKVHDGK